MFNKSIFAASVMLLAQLSFAGKIYIFDANEAVMRTQYAQQKVQEFESTPEFAKMRAQFESLNADLEILSKEMQSKSMTWSDEEKLEHRKKMETAHKNRNIAAQMIQQQQNALLQAIAGEIQPKLAEVVKKYSESNNIDFLISKKAVEYLNSEKSDVTSDITAELDKLK